MNNQTRKLLFDVLESARSIRVWCRDRSFADYQADRQFRRAVEREFEIMGERSIVCFARTRLSPRISINYPK